MTPSLLAFALGLFPQTQNVADEEILGRPPDSRNLGTDGVRTTKGPKDHGGRPTPPDGDDVQVSSVDGADQDETPMRVDPTDRLHLIGGANDNRTGPYNCAFYATLDGGLTWNELFFPDPGGFGNAGDPAAAIGPNGETYFCALAFSGNSEIYVGRSFDGGVTVPNWVVAVPAGGNRFEDKQFMQADQGSGPLGGALYVTWTRFRGTNPIFGTSSFDNGQTWTTAKRISDSDSCQGSCPSVGPNGELYVAFFDFNDSSIKIDVSLDGGNTWGTDVKVSDVDSIGSVPNTGFRANSFPAMDVDTSGGPFNGNIYVCWADDQGSQTDVLMAQSSDGGQTWSTPIPVHDVLTNCQFSPWVDVDANGNVNFGFYDRRDNPGDVRIGYYVSRSSDGCATFQTNVKVADKSYNPNTYNQGFFIGDYTGLAASDRTIHPIWTDGRNDTNDIFTSRVQLDIHTDVAGISAATGGTANFTLNPGPLYAGADYMILGSVSGTTPGLTFGTGVNLPLNFDAFMLLTIQFANSGGLPGFLGNLDATGTAAAALNTGGPINPSLVGTKMDFAAIVSQGGGVRWASNPTRVTIDP